MKLPHDSNVGVPEVIIFKFLSPVEIPNGKALILRPDRSIEQVDYIPKWYWVSQDRIVAKSDVYLKKNVLVYTYFLCYEDENGCKFATVFSHQREPFIWKELKRSRTLDEARQFQAAVRQAWWDGPPELSDAPDPRGADHDFQFPAEPPA